ncbi:MAG: hypothetical protein SGBAC_001878 [Bacillariaceae sp.]
MTTYHYCGNEGEIIPRVVSELVIHPFVQCIPEKACKRHVLLTRVNFNGSALKTIGRHAFYDCIVLKEIEIPPSVTAIEDHTFNGCRSLTRVLFHDDGLLTTIGAYSFEFCTSLTDISIPSSVETIRICAFKDCKCLLSVSFQEGLKIIESRSFGHCPVLENVDIPGSLEVLGRCAFCGCTSLREVNIEAGNLRAIGSRSFESCVNLQTISIPSTVECIEASSFCNCESLEVVKFQNGLKCLHCCAFESCKNLQAVELPETMERICLDAFRGCPRLVSVGLADPRNAVTICTDAFLGCESLVNICLPSTYHTANDYSSKKPFCSVHVDGFQGCTALENQCAEISVACALMSRFENLPIHKKCYHAYATTTDELALEIESLTQSSRDDEGDLFIDRFGMTPFHILLSAASCRIDLLQVLLDAYPPDVLGCKDVNGTTAVEYYSQRRLESEGSRNILRIALERWMVDSVSSWKGLDRWRSDMSTRVNAIVSEEVVDRRQSLLEAASRALSRYERIEATSLLELSLWKLEQTTASASADDSTKNNMVQTDDRETFRIRSGASVVIPNVIALL